jgi:MFS family permease
MQTTIILLVFLLMGVADAMGPMSSAVQKNFQLSAVMSTLMPFFVFIAFAVFSVPGGVMAARIGKKKVLLLAEKYCLPIWENNFLLGFLSLGCRCFARRLLEKSTKRKRKNLIYI